MGCDREEETEVVARRAEEVAETGQPEVSGRSVGVEEGTGNGSEEEMWNALSQGIDEIVMQQMSLQGGSGEGESGEGSGQRGEAMSNEEVAELLLQSECIIF